MDNDRHIIPLKDCPTGGCGAKLDPADLAACLGDLPAFHQPDLLAGFGHSEDAAVYRLGDNDAVVSTVDFFPPMVEDPRSFGRIAAANAVSDIYAMGGTVLFALNLVCFPEKMDKAILREILAGGAEKITEAGAAVAGGHSIYDSGLKYGLAVTGRVHPKRFYRNNGCHDGDCLILTKALGAGLVLSAARAGLAKPEELRSAITSMERLNRDAAEKLGSFPVNAVTDVTGFGLMVHALEMSGDGLTLTFDFDSLPLLPGALDHAANYLATAAGQRNRNHTAAAADVSRVSPAAQEVVFDPQTSGGLLISVPASHAQALCDAIRQNDPAAAIVGQVSARERDGFSVAVV